MSQIDPFEGGFESSSSEEISRALDGAVVDSIEEFNETYVPLRYPAEPWVEGMVEMERYIGRTDAEIAESFEKVLDEAGPDYQSAVAKGMRFRAKELREGEQT